MTVQNSVPTPIVPVMDFPSPDTKKFKAKFFYNYYVKDEATNDLGRVPDELSSIPGEEITNKQLNKFMQCFLHKKVTALEDNNTAAGRV